MVAARPCNVFVVLRSVRNCLTIIIIIIINRLKMLVKTTNPVIGLALFEF